MLNAHPSRRPGGALVLVLVGVGLVSVGTFAAVSFKGSPRGRVSVGGGVTSVPRLIQPGEVATVLHLAGITPEALAAAGAGAAECESIFQTGGAFCLQAERLDQFQIAHRDLNQARNHAVHPEAAAPANASNQAITTAEAQIALDNVSNAAFTFLTTGLDPAVAARLARIKANSTWGLPAPYLTVNRTDGQWLGLRAALAARAYANSHGLTLDSQPNELLTAAQADGTVAQALQDSAGSLASIRQSWQGHEHSAP